MKIKSKAKKGFGKIKKVAKKGWNKGKEKLKMRIKQSENIKTPKKKRSKKGTTEEERSEKDLQKSDPDVLHVPKGEFVVTKESRQLFALFVFISLSLLLLLGVGEAVFAFVAYLVTKTYSDILVHTFTISQLNAYMLYNFFMITISGAFFFWVIDGYRKAEEEELINKIRRSQAWIKFAFYGSIALAIGLIASMLVCSRYFKNFEVSVEEQIKANIESYADLFKDSKHFIDRLQYTFSCCGNEKYEEWFQIQLSSDVHKTKEYLMNTLNYGSSEVDQLFNRSVPFSCCKKDSNPCRFYGLKEDIKDLTINTKGCKEEVTEGIKNLKTGIKLYRLLELLVLFCYAILIHIIQSSLQSEYDLRLALPTARFPTFYAVLSLVTLVVLYYFTF